MVSFFDGNVKDKRPLLRERCFIGLTNHSGHGFSPCGFVMSQKHGASALGLKRVLGRYNTAWNWLHKWHWVRPGQGMSCSVEVENIYSQWKKFTYFSGIILHVPFVCLSEMG